MHQKITVTKLHTIVTTNKQTTAIANVQIKNTCNQLFDVASDLPSDLIEVINPDNELYLMYPIQMYQQ